jgi:hypothetical protein
MMYRRLSWLVIVLMYLAGGCDRSSSAPTTVATASAAPKPSSAAPEPSASAKPAGDAPTVVTFDADPLGEPSPSFEAVVGDWYVAEDGGARGLKVDGAKWRNGQPSASLADQAKRLYGERYAEFLDGVKAFAFFPFAVYRREPPTSDMRVRVRFYPEAGKIDQAAGIAFGIAADGSYLGVRANALEDNMLFFRVVKGKRTIIDTIRGVSTSTRAWHTLSIDLRQKHLVVELDGQKRFEKTLDAVPSGRVGLWSKADSQVLFDDFEITP